MRSKTAVKQLSGALSDLKHVQNSRFWPGERCRVTAPLPDQLLMVLKRLRRLSGDPPDDLWRKSGHCAGAF